MDRTGKEKIGTNALTLGVAANISYVATVLLNCAGVFVAERIGISGLVAVALAFLAAPLLTFALSIRAIVKLRRFDKAYLALAISLLTYGILRTGAMQRRVESWNFESRLARRTEVVEMARGGKLQPGTQGPCDCFYADLPSQYSDLSAGGIVLVSRHSGGFSVVFYVERAYMFSDDDYSAFVFRVDGNPPRTEEEDTYRFYEIRPIQPHWFFVRHT